MKSVFAAIGLAMAVFVLTLSGCGGDEPTPTPAPAEPNSTSAGIQTPSAPVLSEAEQAAVHAANAWLMLIDLDEYGESWENTTEFFRSAVSKADWEKSLTLFRKPLGALQSRKVKSAKYTTTAPGAPDGEYVIIQLDTTFTNKQSAVETITPMKDSNGQWRVSGYFVK